MKATRMKKQVVAIVVLIVVAALAVAGCFINNTPSPTAAYEFKTGF
jgi:flagellar basal body-associated protein FliL